MNEEEVKNNIILPFLKMLGFDASNLSFEDSFTIQWGRSQAKINKIPLEGNPRSDILVKENGENRFIIEVKTDGKKLVDNDERQAISYGRLILPSICPFAILTNGKETKIFDTYSGEDLTNKGIKESKYVKSGYKLELDDEIRNEAISRLITLSYHNLENLCKYQVQDTMSRLKTTKKDALKNYIPEAFILRSNILSSINDFLASDVTSFLINGHSGLGKTNIMCNLAERFSSSHPVLFFAASQITTNLDSCIANEFNWNFSTHKSPEQYVKQLHPILEQHGRDLLIFVDAIDEWPLDDVEIQLSEFVNRIKNKRIRLILSCKISRIPGFLQSKAIPLPLKQNLFTLDGYDVPSITLSKFDDSEVKEAVKLYKNYFGFINEISGATLEECKDPSLLRAISEIYQVKEVPSELKSIKIYQKYLDIKLEKANGQKSRIVDHLTNITKIMFDEHCDEIYESDLKNIDHDAHHYCIDFGILAVSTDKSDRNKIRFVSEGLRNFIISNYQEKLDTLNPEQLEAFAKKYVLSQCGKEFLLWYNSTTQTSTEKIPIKIIEEEDKTRAREYLSKIVEIAKRDFPSIWKISIQSEQMFGLLVLYNEQENYVMRYGFRKPKENESELIWLNKRDWDPFTDKTLFHLMQQYEVSSMISASRDFTTESPESYAYTTVFGLVSKYIKERKLDESGNLDIALEKLFALIPKCGYLFGLPNYHEYYLREILPLDIRRIREYFESFASGFENKRHASISLGPRFTSLGPNSDSILTFEDVSNILDTISAKKNVIESTVLPLGDESEYPQWYTINRSKDYSKEGILKYANLFFQKVLSEYKTLVENNFPTIKDSLETYQKFPIYVIGQLHKSNGSNKADGMMYAILKNVANENEVEIRNYDAEPVMIEHDTLERGFLIETRHGKISTNRYTSGMSLDHLFIPYNETGPFRNCPLTNMVYSLLNDDLKSLYGEKYRGYPF